MKRYFLPFLSLLIVSSSVQGAQSFTVEQILSAPFPADLVAAPRQGKLAWTQNAQGKRSIWIAEAPDYRGRAIVTYDEDDGQELSQLRFEPGGDHIVFVRGGAANRDGEIPNPESVPGGAEQAVWIVSADGSEKPRKLAEGEEPAFSPDGETIALLKEGRIWTVPAVEEGEAKELAKTRGQVGSLRWSPGGGELAFVSRRGDHAFVGLYSFDTKTIRYLDPGLGHDEEPVWSPDGARIAFIRSPNERQILPFVPQRSALPWSIRIADAKSGEGRQVWIADEGRGSAFHGIVAESQILWGKDDRIVFPWEKNGWTQLYSVSASGGEAELLTPGELEVEHVALTPDRSEVLFSSNQGDIDRRHLWRVPVLRGPPTAISQGSGIEWSPVPAGADSDGSAIAYLASDARRPAQAMVKVGSEAARALAPETLPRDFPIDALVEPEPVSISASDGMRIAAQLFRPKDHRPGEQHKAAVFFHGGSRRQMLLGWHYMYYYHNTYALNQYLASRGYVVLSVNYRSGIGYGLDFREALDYGANGASEFRDVVGAGLYLRSRDDVDPDAIGLWGGSYGGYLTALGLARASDLFAAGVDIHGVHDWNVVIRNFVPTYQAEKRAEVARLAFESSPMASIATWRSPVLLIHGDDDRNVPFSESVDLAEALAKQEVEFEELVFPDDVHDFLLHRNWVAAFEAASDFFDRRLGSKPATTNDP
ncbi:MAG: prolyl oligopeptidase family serine peptidase [Vicinamibacteria bacterium]